MKAPIIALALTVFFAGPVFAQTQSEIDGWAASARPLSITELLDLYSDKTWAWRDGGAYYSPQARYAAYTSGPGNEYFSTGMWYAKLGGQLCVTSRWVSAEYKALPSREECLDHRILGNRIFQKNRHGVWYIFKDRDQPANDEWAHFKDGDQISAEHVKMVKKVYGM